MSQNRVPFTLMIPTRMEEEKRKSEWTGTVGAILGPLVALILIPYTSYHNIFFVTVIPGVVAFLIVALYVKEVLFTPLRKQEILEYDKSKTPPRFIQSYSRLPMNFRRFLVGVGLFGISNFSVTLFVLRTQQFLIPSLGEITATSHSYCSLYSC
jgi:MFS family permease